MSEIIGVITSIEDDEYPVGKTFKKVTLGTGQVLKVKHGRDEALFNKWGLLQEGVATKFIMQDFTKPDGVKIPFVADIQLVGDELPPSVKPDEILPEHQEEIAKATAPSGQATGMVTNNITNLIIASVNAGKGVTTIMRAVFGEEASIELVKWYRGQVLGITRINYDGAKLPQFDKEG